MAQRTKISWCISLEFLIAPAQYYTVGTALSENQVVCTAENAEGAEF